MAYKDKEAERAYHRRWEREHRRSRPYTAKTYECRKRWARTAKGKATLKRVAQAFRDRNRVRLSKQRSHLKQRYGLTVADWDRILITQAGLCACCGEPLVHGRGPLVDHDHLTGEFRGLVCHDCNIAVGWFEGRGERLRQAQMYLAAFARKRIA